MSFLVKLWSEPIGAWYVHEVYTQRPPTVWSYIRTKSSYKHAMNMRAKAKCQSTFLQSKCSHNIDTNSHASLSYTHKSEHQVMQCHDLCWLTAPDSSVPVSVFELKPKVGMELFNAPNIRICIRIWISAWSGHGLNCLVLQLFISVSVFVSVRLKAEVGWGLFPF